MLLLSERQHVALVFQTSASEKVPHDLCWQWVNKVITVQVQYMDCICSSQNSVNSTFPLDYVISTYVAGSSRVSKSGLIWRITHTCTHTGPSWRFLLQITSFGLLLMLASFCTHFTVGHKSVYCGSRDNHWKCGVKKPHLTHHKAYQHPHINSSQGSALTNDSFTICADTDTLTTGVFFTTT